jgi:flagellar protein FlgJ
MMVIKGAGTGFTLPGADSLVTPTSQFPVSKREDAKALGAVHDAAKAEYEAKKDKLKKTTQDFEAVFLGMMLKQMRKSIAGENALFGNSHEAKMYQDMMDDSTAKHLSKAGTFGLSNLLYKTMERSLPTDPDKD